jgi:hypothetical protein
VDVEVDVALWYISWQAALTPDLSMIPPDDVLTEIENTFQDQEWSFVADILPVGTSDIFLEGM